MIFLRMILSGSILFSEPTAATTGEAASPIFLRAMSGRGGKEIGAKTEAIENRPAWRNFSILCLSEFIVSDEYKGLQWNKEY